MNQVLEILREAVVQGGLVAYPLLVSAIAIGFGLGYRAWLLAFDDRRPIRAIAKDALRGKAHQPKGLVARAAVEGARVLHLKPVDADRALKAVLQPYEQVLERYQVPVSALVKTAPLLGLLGTVTGMIATFDALGDTRLFAEASVGVAGGISEALFSTQLGLLVAIPGLVVGRLLTRRADRCRDRLAQLREALRLEGVQA